MPSTTHRPKRRDTLAPPNCTNATLRKATRAMTQLYDSALQPAGLRATQFSLLAVLASRGDLPVSEMADLLVMDRTTLTRNLKPLEKQGLVAISAGQDRRVRVIGLTRDGRRTLRRATALWRDAQARVAAGLGRQRWNRLLDDLAVAVEVARTV